MEQNDYQSVLKLLNLLSGSKVSTQAMQLALTLIQKEFSLSDCYIYEVDGTGELYLNEALSCGVHDDITHFVLNDQRLQQQQELTNRTMSYIVNTNDTTDFEKQFLEFYKVNTIVMAPICDENANIMGMIVLTWLDEFHITESKKSLLEAHLAILANHLVIRMYQTKLEQTQTTLESILDNAGIDIYANDFYTHDILYVNESMAAPYGGKTAFMNRKCWEVLFPGQSGPCEFCPQKKLIDEFGEPSNVYSWDYQRAFDGSWFRVFSASFRWVDGRLAHIVSSADITDNKRNEALIENMANYDQLTKLPNRRMLVQECERRITNASDLEQGYLLFFDLDKFKDINDTYGHDAGDEFLIQLGEFFSSIPLLKDAIYRNGGDEFVAIIGGEHISKDHIKNLANFIHERFKKPWVLKQGSVYCNTSIGVACYPEDGRTTEKLLQKADMAMYQVKRAGGKGICFGYELDEYQK